MAENSGRYKWEEDTPKQIGIILPGFNHKAYASVFDHWKTDDTTGIELYAPNWMCNEALMKNVLKGLPRIIFNGLRSKFFKQGTVYTVD